MLNIFYKDRVSLSQWRSIHICINFHAKFDRNCLFADLPAWALTSERFKIEILFIIDTFRDTLAAFEYQSYQVKVMWVKKNNRVSWTAQFEDEFPARGRGFGHRRWLNRIQVDLTVCHVRWVLFLQGYLHLSSWFDLQQTYVGRWGRSDPTSLHKWWGTTPRGKRATRPSKESARRPVLSLQACSSLTPLGGTSLFAEEVGLTYPSTFPHRFVRDQTMGRGTASLAKKSTHQTWQTAKWAVSKNWTPI